MELSLQAVRKTDTGPCAVRTVSIAADLHKAIEVLEQRVPGSTVQIDEERSDEDTVYFVLRMSGPSDTASINEAFSGILENQCLHVFTTFAHPK